MEKRIIDDNIHCNKMMNKAGQKHIDRQEQKTNIARKQESRNVPDCAILITSCAFTFWKDFSVL